MYRCSPSRFPFSFSFSFPRFTAFPNPTFAFTLTLILALALGFTTLASIFAGCLPGSCALAVSGGPEHPKGPEGSEGPQALQGPQDSQDLHDSQTGPGRSIVTGVRFKAYPEKVRVVFDLTSPVAYTVSQLHNPPKIIIEMDNAYINEAREDAPQQVQQAQQVQQVQAVDDVALRAIRINQIERGRVRAVLDLRYALPRPQVFTLVDPDRIVVDIPKQYEERRRISIASGIKYIQIDKGTALGPVMIDMLDVDLNDPKISIRTSLAQESGFGRAPVSAIVAREGAIAGINGVYFDSTGRPLGLIILDGQIITEPLLGRTALGITRDKEVLMGNVGFNSTVTVRVDGLAARSFAIDGINRVRRDGEVILYTPFFGATTRTNDHGMEVAVAGGRVVVVGNSDLEIPRDGYVISAHGKAKGFLAGLKPGDEVEIRIGLTSDWMERGVVYAVGGGPRLVENGQVRITSAEERFGPDIALSRAPRTAVGVTADRHLLLVAVSGRRRDISIGMTLEELAEFMVGQGAVDAMNFDGGGSSTMVVRDYVINLPSDGAERKVGDAILLFVEDSGLFDYGAPRLTAAPAGRGDGESSTPTQ